MIIDSLKQLILNTAQFQDDELEMISTCFEENHFRQKTLIISEGKKTSSLHFIVSGLVRNYHLKDGKEVTTYLACDGGIAASFSSFLTEGVSPENVQCLEDTHTFSISYEKMTWLYKQLPQWLAIGKMLAEQHYLCMADRILKLHATPAKERYLAFLESQPAKIVQQTPLIHVASFLGIAPESLSRIRRSIS